MWGCFRLWRAAALADTAQLELHLPAKAVPFSVQGFSCFADQAVLGALLAVEKPLRASECARCAPCPAPALLLHRRTWLLPPARVCLWLWLHYVHYGHAFALLPQEQVCGRVSVLTSTLHGALEHYVRALRCCSRHRYPYSPYRYPYNRGVPVGQCPHSRWRCTLNHWPSPQAVRLSI